MMRDRPTHRGAPATPTGPLAPRTVTAVVLAAGVLGLLLVAVLVLR